MEELLSVFSKCSKLDGVSEEVKRIPEIYSGSVLQPESLLKAKQNTPRDKWLMQPRGTSKAWEGMPRPEEKPGNYRKKSYEIQEEEKVEESGNLPFPFDKLFD